MGKRRANGEGSVKKRSNGTWEGRVTIDNKRKSIYGKTREEVREKMAKIIAERDEGIYIEPTKMTVADMVQLWQTDYLVDVAPSTKARYDIDVRLRILPTLGRVLLSDLTSPMIQRMYHQQLEKGLSVKSLRCLHGVMHSVLALAVELGYIRKNVSESCRLPRVAVKKINTVTDERLSIFLQAIHGHSDEDLFFITVFTGMRLGEVVGLTWDCIDFDRGRIHLYRQLIKDRGKNAQYHFGDLKNHQQRVIVPAEAVMNAFKRVKIRQAQWQLKNGLVWSNPEGFVFTNEAGEHLKHATVYKHYKALMEEAGMGHYRFHDLRHTYATLALQNGTDVKTVSSTMGHSTTAFTMDKYGHVSEAMQKDSSQRMQRLIEEMV